MKGLLTELKLVVSISIAFEAFRKGSADGKDLFAIKLVVRLLIYQVIKVFLDFEELEHQFQEDVLGF